MKTRRFFQAIAAATLALAASMAMHAAAPADALSDADRTCLGCHGQEGLTKAFDAGDSLSLTVDAQAFAQSVHAPLGCATCHASVDLKKHPGASAKFASARAFSVAGAQTCRNCHGEIYEAYAASVHGKAAAQPESAAPVCSSCHSAHAVRRASVGSHLRDTCATCHASALAAHDKWLPNTQLHLQVVACASCHAPSAKHRVDLRLYDATKAGEPTLAVAPGVVDNRSLDEGSMRALVRKVNADGTTGKVTLVGRIEPASPPEGHRLATKDRAVKDCAACHRKGAEPFQTVSLSIVDSEGKRTRYDAAASVLNTPTSVDSVRGFYAVGGTRIQALDIVLALALAGGIGAPLGHMIMRKLSKKGRDHV